MISLDFKKLMPQLIEPLNPKIVKDQSYSCLICPQNIKDILECVPTQKI